MTLTSSLEAGEQTAWRLSRNMNAEFVAERGGTFWVSIAVEDETKAQEALTEVLESTGLTEERVRIVDANRVSSDEVRRILEGARILAGDVGRTSNGDPLRKMVDLHYDVPKHLRAWKDDVNRYVFGYRLRRNDEHRSKSYRYPGVVHRKGVRWIGQSVLRLPPAIAKEAEARFHGWAIPVAREEVFESY